MIHTPSFLSFLFAFLVLHIAQAPLAVRMMAIVRRLSACCVGALLLSHLPLASCAHPIVRFTYQSHMNNVDAWFTMFTLCLAPLVSHIALGLPKTVIMESCVEHFDNDHHSKHLYPPWAERITLFNPITIVWRYYAIAYFRFRSLSWDCADLAAVNAAFWDPTTRRWDGTEATLLSAHRYLTAAPETSYVRIISGSTLASIVLTLQGVQAICFMIRDGFPAGLAYTFLPIGLLGLWRLPAAAWVTNEWGYSFDKRKKQKDQEEPWIFRNDLSDRVFKIGQKSLPTEYTAIQMVEVPDDSGHGPSSATKWKLLERGDWKCYAYRAWWILSVTAPSALGIRDIVVALTPLYVQIPESVSSIIYQAMYLELCGAFLFITPVLVLRSDHTSTIIPCIQSLWYKLLTVLMFLTALAAVIVASLETVQLPDGSYMSSPPLVCYGQQCEPWNKTAILEEVGWEWDRFFNLSHIGG